MAVQYLEYSLVDGFIHNWLVAGPQALPFAEGGATSLEAVQPRSREVTQRFVEAQPGVTQMPVDRDTFETGGESLTWRYYRCHEDHLVDVSGIYPLPQYLRTWAYTRLVTPAHRMVTFHLSTRGMVEAWLDGKSIFRKEDFGPDLQTISFQAGLAGENELFIRFDRIGERESLNQLALRLVPETAAAAEIKVKVPTHARFPHRHLKFERIFEMAYLEEVANYRGTHVNLRWAEDLDEELRYMYQIQDSQERIYVEGTWDANSKDALDIGHPQRIFERPLYVVLRAPGKEYYDQNLRYQRRLPITVLDNQYSSEPSGSVYTRRREGLAYAARREGDLFAEIAKMALGEWAKLDPAAIRGAIDQVRRGKAGAEALLAGLLGVIYRFSEDDNFPADLKEPVEEVVLGFEYAREPEVESQAILLYTCEILAGQRYPERSFIASAKEGRQHRERGERLALEWLRERGQRGFEEWNSSCAFEWEFLALSHLASLAASDPVRELAAVLMDKMLFLIAVNSYQGALGSTHGQARASTIKSAKLEATSGITRMLWGLGVYNAHILGMVSLACSDYEYPSFYAELASQLPEEMWSRERHVFDGSEANLAACKTQDYLLSSAQDYRPGQKGRSEHIWQATMGPDAVVFANHPAWMSESEAHQPGFWLGNAILPRVAQWKDILIAVHNLPEGDWMGFTHAYFPIYAFDEWELDGGWAFARKGKGYLAITAKAGIELIKRGPDGYRELRSYGRENIWLCHMGRDDVDGYFRSFKKDILKMRPEWGPLSVRFNSLRKEKLSFGWEGPLLVDGNEQPITGFKHIDNPYCTVDLPAKQMDIAYGEVVLRLNFD